MLFRDIFRYMKKGEIIKNGLVLWLDGHDFLNNPASVIWRDRSGNANNLIPTGFAFTTLSGSNGKGSIVLDNVNDYFYINDKVSLDNLGNVTVRFNLKTINKHSILFGKGHTNIGIKILVTSTGYLCVWCGNGTTKDLASTNVNVLANTDYILSVNFSNNSQKIYLNGALVATQTYQYVNSPETLAIGYTNDDYGSTSFDGKIYSILAYNRNLTDSEILQNYNTLR